MEDITTEKKDKTSPTGCGFCLCSWQTDGDADSAELTLPLKPKGDPLKTLWVQANVMTLTSFNRLTHDQQSGFGAVAQMYCIA